MKIKVLILSFLLLLVSRFSFSQNLYFPPITGNQWDTISSSTLGWCQSKIDSFYTYLEMNNTKAFILLKDGKIVLEQYFNQQKQSDFWYWASAGKTITSFLVGMAQQNGLLSIKDTTSNYLGTGWTSALPEKEEKITIWHQLTMTSGLDDGVPDYTCTADSCLIYKADAGTRWAYHNGPYTLLHSVIENATGQTVNNFLQQELKIPTGIDGSFIKLDNNRVYFSTARSMARFGLLMLNNGNWNGNQIMTDTTYFNDMITTSQNINKSYGYLWWLNGKSSYMLPKVASPFSGTICPNAPKDMYVAMGKNGQFVNVIPSKNMVWIRMGEAPNNFLVPYFMNDEIWEYINELDCSLGIKENKQAKKVSIFPNPVGQKLTVE